MKKATTFRLARMAPAVFLTAALGVGAALGLTACGGQTDQGQQPSGTTSQQPTATPSEKKDPVSTQLKDLDLQTDITDLDVTGDGTPNILRIEAEESTSGFLAGVDVLVDGKSALQLPGESKDLYYYTAQARYVMTSNGVPFLELSCTGDNDYAVVNGLYGYDAEKGQFTQALDFVTFVDEEYGTHRRGAVNSVDGTTISVKYGLMSYILGYGLTFAFDYDVADDGTLKRTSDQTERIEYVADNKECTAQSNEYFKLNRKVDGYAQPDDDSAKTILKKGTKITPKVVAVVDGDDLFVQFQEKGTGQSYWIEADVAPDYAHDQIDTLLDGVMYAG